MPLHCEQRFSIMQKNAATKERRTRRAGELGKLFSHKRSIERCVWRDEKDFTLQVALNHQNDRVYGACEKKEISLKRLSRHQNKQSIKVYGVGLCNLEWCNKVHIRKCERSQSQCNPIQKAS